MSLVQQAQQLIRDWSIDIYAGWSIMDLVYLGMALAGATGIYLYFFQKADTK